MDRSNFVTELAERLEYAFYCGVCRGLRHASLLEGETLAIIESIAVLWIGRLLLACPDEQTRNRVLSRMVATTTAYVAAMQRPPDAPPAVDTVQ